MKSRRVEILVAAVVLFVSASPVMAVLIEFNDGGVHDIDYEIDDNVWVDFETPGMGTTVNILEGGSIIYHDLKCFEDSIINMSGGFMAVNRVGLGCFFAYDSSQVTVSGGEIDILYTHNASQVSVSGGSINDDLYALDSSQVTVSGGSINGLKPYGSSQVTVSGGSIEGNLDAYDSSQITVSGGEMNRLFARGSSQVTVSGGLIVGPREGYLSANDSSQITVSGGSMSHLYANHSSQVTVSGGSIGGELRAYGDSQVTVSGGEIGGELLADIEGILTIHGSDFAVDGMPVGYIELSSILGGYYRDEPYRQLTGILLSGDPINNQFRIGHSGTIVLVPEPATLLLLGLGGLALRKFHRRER